jgi:hypothetical protein
MVKWFHATSVRFWNGLDDNGTNFRSKAEMDLAWNRTTVSLTDRVQRLKCMVSNPGYCM